MSIFRPAYCNRFEPMRALDFAPGVDVTAQVDRALGDAAENIEGDLKRVFFPSDDTRWFDWPSQGGTGGGQYADPWRLWFDDNDLVCTTALVAGGVSLGLNQLFLAPWDNPRKYKPYYTRVEIDRATSASFGNQQQTPQYSIGISGTWGYGADADPAGTLAATVGQDDTTVTGSDGSAAAPGDLIVLGYGRASAPFPGSDPHAGAIAPYLGERVLITDVSAVETGLTQATGCTTAEDNDQALTWTGSGSLNTGEVITLDSEQMLVEQITGSVATVRRAYAGTTIAEHSGALIWAWRQWSVLRAQLGTSYAGPYEQGAAVYRHRVPSLVRGLGIALVENQLLQEGSGYARIVGSGESARPAPGAGLARKWDEARQRHGRGNKARQRTV